MKVIILPGEEFGEFDLELVPETTEEQDLLIEHWAKECQPPNLTSELWRSLIQNGLESGMMYDSGDGVWWVSIGGDEDAPEKGIVE